MTCRPGETVDLLPDILSLGPEFPNLTAVAFNCMKALPAEFIVAEAERDGRIGKNTVIVETSSGSFALGLALACRKRSLRLEIVGDPAISPSRLRKK